MKKVVYALLIIFGGSQLFTSCSSGNEVLTQFSKRKYLKNFKVHKLKEDNTIKKQAVDDMMDWNNYASASEETDVEEVVAVPVSNEELERADVKSDLSSTTVLENNPTKWEYYNRKMDFSNLDFDLFGSNEQKETFNSAQASSITPFLLVILSFIIPPLAVYLYEMDITSHFWIDLLLTLFLWVPGVIFALLVVLGAI